MSGCPVLHSGANIEQALPGCLGGNVVKDIRARSFMTASKLPKRKLKPEHEDIVKATLPAVGANIGDIAKLFYQKMFTAHPELIANTFNRGNQKQGAQQKALAASVATYATMLVDPEAPNPFEMMSRIAHKHCSLGIVESQYKIVEKYLFEAIIEIIKPTAEIGAAWSEVYWNFANDLIAMEKELYSDAKVTPGDVFMKAKVVKREEESPTVVSFTLESSDEKSPLPKFLPGQYTSLGVTLPDGARQLRQYSMVSNGEAGRWRIAVKRVDPVESAPAGEVSNWLHKNAQEGTELEATLPYGDLTIDLESKAPLVLASAGVGCTPMMGILAYLVANDKQRQVVILHADRSSDEHAMRDEMEQMAKELPNSHMISWYHKGVDEETHNCKKGFMDLTKVDVPADAEVYLCGPTRFLQSARDALAGKGIKEGHVHYELFAPNDWLLPS